jgi:hypothetical protein
VLGTDLRRSPGAGLAADFVETAAATPALAARASPRRKRSGADVVVAWLSVGSIAKPVALDPESLLPRCPADLSGCQRRRWEHSAISIIDCWRSRAVSSGDAAD